jgi:hypothetical protein
LFENSDQFVIRIGQPTRHQPPPTVAHAIEIDLSLCNPPRAPQRLSVCAGAGDPARNLLSERRERESNHMGYSGHDATCFERLALSPPKSSAQCSIRITVIGARLRVGGQTGFPPPTSQVSTSRYSASSTSPTDWRIEAPSAMRCRSISRSALLRHLEAAIRRGGECCSVCKDHLLTYRGQKRRPNFTKSNQSLALSPGLGSKLLRFVALVSRKRTPTPPPFSAIKTMPAVSKAERSLSRVDNLASRPVSKRVTVACPTAAARARSAVLQSSAVRAIRH